MLKLVYFCLISAATVAHAVADVPFPNLTPDSIKRRLAAGESRDALIDQIRRFQSNSNENRRAFDELLAGLTVGDPPILPPDLQRTSVGRLVARLPEYQSPIALPWLLVASRSPEKLPERLAVDAAPVLEIISAGDLAIPSLIAVSDCKILTRSVHEPIVLPNPLKVNSVGEIAMRLIEHISGCQFHLECSTKSKKHLQDWWRATGKLGKAERIAWQFRHNAQRDYRSGFVELRKLGKSSLLKKILLENYKGILHTPRVADMLCDLGETTGINECKEQIDDVRLTIRAEPVMHLVKWGTKEDFRYLAGVCRRARDGDTRAKKFLSQIVLSCLERQSNPDTALVFAEVLHIKDAYQGKKRFCDIAISAFAANEKGIPFNDLWDVEKRDLAISKLIARKKQETR